MNLKDLYRILRSGHVHAQGIVDTLDAPLVALDADLTVVSANRAFFSTVNVDGDETIGRPLLAAPAISGARQNSNSRRLGAGCSSCSRWNASQNG
jgi:hypothetical protein